MQPHSPAQNAPGALGLEKLDPVDVWFMNDLEISGIIYLWWKGHRGVYKWALMKLGTRRKSENENSFVGITDNKI